ncbi:hypothetical protein V2W45_1473955 [Cenococcum geophilum]
MLHIPWTNDDNIDPISPISISNSNIMLVHPVPASRFMETTTEDLIRIRQHLLASPGLQSVVRQGGTFHVGPEIMERCSLAACFPSCPPNEGLDRYITLTVYKSQHFFQASYLHRELCADNVVLYYSSQPRLDTTIAVE